MKGPLALVGVGCWLALALPMPAWGATDYDGDGYIGNDCAPLDAAAHPGAPDVPDVALEDLDCDGVDGSATGAFFVSTTGSNAGSGSAADPFRTIAFAVGKAAAATPKRDVYVQAGTYTEHVVLAGGVSIYGGYGPGGTRALASATTIQAPAGQPEAVLADGATGVELQLLEIKGSGAASGASSYAVRAIAGASLALISVKATGGSAGAGGTGSTGSTGTPGNAGRCGGRQTNLCDINSIGGSGGSGAAGGGVPGGKGADGVQNSLGTNGAGGASTAAVTGGSGGTGGQLKDPCSDQPIEFAHYCGGQDGLPGGTGADGARGAGAAFGIAGAGATWANPAAAATGDPGAPGSGGGGGGSGYSSTSCVSGSGGGGGGSGTGGTGGGGGSNGGGSFGVYLAGSALVVDGGLVRGGNGGAGGLGGDGGLGGGGGAGGAFQPPAGAGCYRGGSGGKGGDGGQGGGGGGGAGGPSVGVFATATSNFAVHANASVAGGTAGSGGVPGAGGAGGSAAGGAGSSAGTLAQPGANATAKDFDGDGKTDAADACPAVPAPGTNGCPARPAKLADADGDAIPDGSDACPALAAGPTDADANGCPGNQADGDGDGYLANGQDCNDGNAAIHPGAIEVVGNKLDENCDGVVAPFPRVAATVSTGGGVTRTTTVFLRLLVHEIPAGAKVQVRCSGGSRRCPFKVERLKVTKKRTADGLKLLPKRKRKQGLIFKPGATLEVRITAPAAIGKVVRYRIVRKHFPTGKTLCLPPGTKKPRACPTSV